MSKPIKSHKKWQPVCNGNLFVSRKRRSKGYEQELREELLQSPQIGIENYPSRKAFATHLSDSHSSTFSDFYNQLLL